MGICRFKEYFSVENAGAIILVVSINLGIQEINDLMANCDCNFDARNGGIEEFLELY